MDKPFSHATATGKSSGSVPDIYKNKVRTKEGDHPGNRLPSALKKTQNDKVGMRGKGEQAGEGDSRSQRNVHFDFTAVWHDLSRHESISDEQGTDVLQKDERDSSRLPIEAKGGDEHISLNEEIVDEDIQGMMDTSKNADLVNVSKGPSSEEQRQELREWKIKAKALGFDKHELRGFMALPMGEQELILSRWEKIREAVNVPGMESWKALERRIRVRESRSGGGDTQEEEKRYRIEELKEKMRDIELQWRDLRDTINDRNIDMQDLGSQSSLNEDSLQEIREKYDDKRQRRIKTSVNVPLYTELTDEDIEILIEVSGNVELINKLRGLSSEDRLEDKQWELHRWGVLAKALGFGEDELGDFMGFSEEKQNEILSSWEEIRVEAEISDIDHWEELERQLKEKESHKANLAPDIRELRSRVEDIELQWRNLRAVIDIKGLWSNDSLEEGVRVFLEGYNNRRQGKKETSLKLPVRKELSDKDIIEMINTSGNKELIDRFKGFSLEGQKEELYGWRTKGQALGFGRAELWDFMVLPMQEQERRLDVWDKISRGVGAPDIEHGKKLKIQLGRKILQREDVVSKIRELKDDMGDIENKWEFIKNNINIKNFYRKRTEKKDIELSSFVESYKNYCEDMVRKREAIGASAMKSKLLEVYNYQDSSNNQKFRGEERLLELMLSLDDQEHIKRETLDSISRVGLKLEKWVDMKRSQYNFIQESDRLVLEGWIEERISVFNQYFSVHINREKFFDGFTSHEVPLLERNVRGNYMTLRRELDDDRELKKYMESESSTSQSDALASQAMVVLGKATRRQS